MGKLIAVGGGTSSGKTTLACQVARELGEENCTLVEEDWYYLHRPERTMKERKKVNYDHPDAVEWTLFREHLHLLCNGTAVYTPRYDFSTHLRSEETVLTMPKPIIIAEGILILCDDEILDMSSFSLFVDTDDDERALRRVDKDIHQRGRTFEESLAQYRGTVKPMHDKFCYPSRRRAKLIVPNGGEDPEVREFLDAGLRALISNGRNHT